MLNCICVGPQLSVGQSPDKFLSWCGLTQCVCQVDFFLAYLISLHISGQMTYSFLLDKVLILVMILGIFGFLLHFGQDARNSKPDIGRTLSQMINIWTGSV